jgi:tetratricopeptide (TPR) repeat protein
MVLGLGPSVSAAPSGADALAARWQAALQQVGQGKCDGAEWTAISQDPAFPKLASAMRSATFINLAACVGGDRTHEWRALAAKEPDAPPLAFALLFLEAVDRRDTNEALADLEADLRAAKRLGMSFVITNDDGIYVLRYNLKDDAVSRRRLFRDLDESNWKPSDPVDDPSSFWADYSTMLLDKGEQTTAARVARKVTAPVDLFGMRLDRRFAPLVERDPATFDVDYAAYATLEHLQRAYAEASDDNGAYEIIGAMRALGRYEDALAFADQVLKKDRIVDHRGRDYRNWIEDRRARVLFDLGRFDEAIAAERTAASRLERGHANLSQFLNLAKMLVSQGRFREALTTLEPLMTTDPADTAFLAGVRVCAFNGLGDLKGQREALAFTAAHVSDNRHARLRALICADDTAGAAAFMIGWLNDPLGLQDALVELCTASALPLSSYDAVLSKRFASVRSDPAVVAAVAKLGHTEALTKVGAIWPTYP